MPLLLLALLGPDNDSHRVSGRQVLTHDLKRLTHGEALALHRRQWQNAGPGEVSLAHHGVKCRSNIFSDFCLTETTRRVLIPGYIERGSDKTPGTRGIWSDESGFCQNL
jgi:hypothetical protein